MKNFQSIGISPVSLNAFTLKNNISQAQKVQVDGLNNSESGFYDKSDMQEKVNVLAGGNARKIENGIIFRTSLVSYLGT